MGGRLSQPINVDGLSESSRPTKPRYRINGRTLAAPLAAFTMAGILFFYSRTSIQAARLNAQKHREADGGQLNWRKESLRRHGHLEQVGGGDTALIREAMRGERAVRSKEASEKLGPWKAERLRSEGEEARVLEGFKKGQRGGNESRPPD